MDLNRKVGQLNPEVVVDRLMDEIQSVAQVEIMGIDSTSMLFRATFVNGASHMGVFYQPGVFVGINEGSWEMED